tara:strand:+ start:3390 stop:3632 length:243 start_codon:yes stop_codon:yes gene_type:complete
MSEKNNEMLMLLKTLVDKVNKLENAVFDSENILMKSGFVVVNTPTPSIDNAQAGNSEVDRIAKMDWEDIGKMVSKLEGGY